MIDLGLLAFERSLLLLTLLRQRFPYLAVFCVSRNLSAGQRSKLFETGADGCISEPFAISEVVIRFIDSMRLHIAAYDGALLVNTLRVGDLELNLISRRTSRRGVFMNLRPKEFVVLEHLVRNVNRLVRRATLIDHVWMSSCEGKTNIVEVYVSALRRKIDRDFNKKMIHTVRGCGYVLMWPECTPTITGLTKNARDTAALAGKTEGVSRKMLTR